MLLQTNQLIIEQLKNSDILDWAKIDSDANVRRFVDEKGLSFEEAIINRWPSIKFDCDVNKLSFNDKNIKTISM